MTGPDVAVLYAARDSIYKALPGLDVWDEDRDARNYAGPFPVVAHPPCRTWSRVRARAKHNPAEHALGPLAVQQVRQWGGVLEHPAGSALWAACNLPAPGRRDAWGFTLGVPQFWFGHLAEKRTLLYVVGIQAGTLPGVPLVLGAAPRTVPSLGKRARSATPLAFAEWLVTVARRIGALRGSRWGMAA